MPTGNLDFFTFLPIQDVTLLIFYIVCFIYISLTIVLYYHWNQYSVEGTVTTVTFILYGATTIPLILALSSITFHN
jgi:hypothetical protein